MARKCAHLRPPLRRIRLHWPNTVIITIRGDGYYGRREAMDWCEKTGIQYLFGLAKNEALDAVAAAPGVRAWAACA
jgi:hypothetical protein